MKINRALIAIAFSLSFASSSKAQLILNGGFEIGVYNPLQPSLNTLGAGNISLTNWTIGGTGVDWIGTLWQHSSGAHSLDLSSTDAGSISQTFLTSVGQQYRISFDMAGNMASGNVIKRLTVQATGGSLQTETFDTTGHSFTSMGWSTRTYDFTASSTSTTVTFASLENNSGGPALDNVGIAAVPEPATCGLVSIGVFAVVWIRKRYRRSAIPAVS